MRDGVDEVLDDRRFGGSRDVGCGGVVTLRLLRRIPADLYAAAGLMLNLDTIAATDTPSVVHRVTGR